MDQSTALSDAFSKTSTSIGGLLSQLNGLLGDGSAQSGLFSDILSQDAALQTTLAASTQAATAQAATATPSVTSSSTLPYTDTDTSSSLVQSLNNLSDTLHTALATLRQQQNSNNASPNQNAQNTANTQTNSASTSLTPSTQTATTPQNTATATTKPTTSQSDNSNGNATKQAATKSTTTSDTTTADTTSTTADVTTTTDTTSDATTSTTLDAKTLADIMAELLALTQMMVRNIQQQAQSQSTSATTTEAAKAIAALADILAQLTKAGVGDDKTDAAKTANVDASANAATTPVDPTVVDANTADASTPVDPFQNLLAALEKTVKTLAAATNVSTSATNASTATTATITATTSTSVVPDTTLTAVTNLADQLAALEEKIKQIFAASQKNSTTATAQNTATDGNTQTTAAKTINAENAPTDWWQAQAASLSAASLTATAAAQSTSQSTSTTAATTTAAFVAVAEKNAADSGADTNADTQSGGSNAANAPTPDARNSNAGATTASSSSFANQLSSLRAVSTPTVNQPAAIDQVILQLNRSVKNGNDQMSLQLHPADLGKITVKLDFTADGKVQGTVTADNPSTLQMLQKDSRNLERALQDAGLRADSGSLQFNLGSQQGGNNQGQAATGDGTGNGTLSANEDGSEGASGSVVDLGSLAETYYVTPGGVNIRV